MSELLTIGEVAVLTVTSRPVTVEVDGSPAGLTAVDTAAAEAERRGAPLVVVHVWGGPFRHPSRTGLVPMPRPEAERLLHAAAQRARALRPGLTVHTRLVLGSAATAKR
jgi:nucleotide-binding universal stress UspA family protein